MILPAAAAEPASTERQAALSGLPEWDLSDLYPGRDSEALTGDLTTLAEEAEAFRARYEGRLDALSGAELGAAVEIYEGLQEKIGRVMSYASLVHAGNLSDPEIGRFYQTMQERTNAVSTALLFFTLEINRLEEADLDAKLGDPMLSHYRPWLRDTRAFRPHQLSDEIEKLLHEKYVAGRAAWTRLFDETIADLRFPFRGKELTEPEALDLLSDKEAGIRREAARVSFQFTKRELYLTKFQCPRPAMQIDTTKIKKETSKEIVRLSELYLDGTIRLAVAADSRAMSLSGMLAASASSLIAAGLTLLFVKDPVNRINLILGVAALAAACFFIAGLWNAIVAAKPKPFNISGSYLEAWRTEDDLYGELPISLIGQAEIYDEQIRENNNVLTSNAEHIGKALAVVKWAPVAALLTGILTYIMTIVLDSAKP